MSNFEIWITRVSDFASLASLIVSVYVAWQLQGIKRRFVKRYAVCSLIKQIRLHKSVLIKFINAPPPNDMSLIAELAKCEANLRSTVPHLIGSPLQDASAALPLFSARPPDLQGIYVIMIRLLQSLENAAAAQEARAHVE